MPQADAGPPSKRFPNGYRFTLTTGAVFEVVGRGLANNPGGPRADQYEVRLPNGRIGYFNQWLIENEGIEVQR